MPTEKQLQPDISELLADITYVNQSNKAEIKQINHQIRLRLANADIPGHETDVIIDEVSSQLGQLTAKVKLAEKAIRSIHSEKNNRSAPVVAKIENNRQNSSIKFGAAQLANGNDPILGNRDIGMAPQRTAAVDQPPASNGGINACRVV